MIVFDLLCRKGGHRFEAWFRSSDDFAMQQRRDLLICPECGSNEIEKAVMAPAVGRKGNQMPASTPARGKEPEVTTPSQDEEAAQVSTVTPEMRKALEAVIKLQKKALENSRWVGNDFADEARKMHYGEQDAEAIHGQATPEQVENLIDEGVEIAPLPFAVPPPDAIN